jgi:crotonobetainyl-CoA:carnitine CoA-transferase CaiB-like acyl-CoA transferase
VVIAAREERHWKNLCKSLMLESIANDPRFLTNFTRVKHRAELLAIMEPILGSDTTENWMKKFRQDDVPASPVNHFDQAFSEPPAIENQAVIECDHPQLR